MRRKNTWTSLRIEIQNLCTKFNLNDSDFAEIGLLEQEEIRKKLWEKFSRNQSSSDIWNSLSQDYVAIEFDFNQKKLSNLTGGKAHVWILLNETVRVQDKYWTYEGTVEAFEKLFSESYLIGELIIASKKYDWMLCLDHHDILYGVGKMKEEIEKIKTMAKKV